MQRYIVTSRLTKAPKKIQDINGFQVAEGSADKITRAEGAAKVAHVLIGLSSTEKFLVIGLDISGACVGTWEASSGELSSCSISPRNVFGPALRLGTIHCVICAHNHPSGSLEPSWHDIEATRRLIESGKLLGIHVVDHVIVEPGGKHVSLREIGGTLIW